MDAYVELNIKIPIHLEILLCTIYRCAHSFPGTVLSVSALFGHYRVEYPSRVYSLLNPSPVHVVRIPVAVDHDSERPRQRAVI